MRFSITLVLLLCVSLAMAQKTQIDKGEKARLENQFKALKTFYINDDGLVVYQVPESQSMDNSSDNDANEDIAPSKPRDNDDGLRKVKDDDSKRTVKAVAKPEPKVYRVEKKTDPSTSQISNRYSISKMPIDPNQVVIVSDNIESVDSDFDETTVLSTDSGESNKASDNGDKSKSQAINNTKKAKEDEKLEASTKKDTNTTIKTKSYPYRSSKFQKYPSKYKDMEEAALAVDDLLEKLKKEQTQNGSGSGSMSSRIARGAGKSALRRQMINDDDFSGLGRRPREMPASRDRDVFEYEEDLYTPTYYINGQEVSKIEVDRLRKKDIISREIRTRNTVSGNPAGEVWLEVREY